MNKFIFIVLNYSSHTTTCFARSVTKFYDHTIWILANCNYSGICNISNIPQPASSEVSPAFIAVQSEKPSHFCDWSTHPPSWHWNCVSLQTTSTWLVAEESVNYEEEIPKKGILLLRNRKESLALFFLFFGNMWVYKTSVGTMRLVIIGNKIVTALLRNKNT